MTTLKKGTKVLVKGKSGIHTISTGEMHSRNRIRVTPTTGRSYQVAVASLKRLTPAQLKIVAQYEKLMSW